MSKKVSEAPALDLNKEGVVSVWFSTVPYGDIPESYFDDDLWQRNFKIVEYDPENMETNGAEEGTVSIEQAVGECSYSRSFVKEVVHKVNKMGVEQVTWVILLYDFEYRPKKTKVYEDEYVKYVASYPYDMNSPSLFDVDEPEA